MSTATPADNNSRPIAVRFSSAVPATVAASGRKKGGDGSNIITRTAIGDMDFFKKFIKPDDVGIPSPKELFQRALQVNGAAAIVELMKHEVPVAVIASYCGLNLSNKDHTKDWNAMMAKIRLYYKAVLAEDYVNSRIQEEYEVPVLTQHGEVPGVFAPRKACMDWLFRETEEQCKVKLNRIDNSAMFFPWELSGSENDWRATRARCIAEYRKVFRTRDTSGSGIVADSVGKSIASTILKKIGG
jgi:hypothetical protein